MLYFIADRIYLTYTQLMNWAVLYDRGYELDIEFNVSINEFQSLYLELEEKGHKRSRGTGEILALASNT